MVELLLDRVCPTRARKSQATYRVSRNATLRTHWARSQRSGQTQVIERRDLRLFLVYPPSRPKRAVRSNALISCAIDVPPVVLQFGWPVYRSKATISCFFFQTTSASRVGAPSGWLNWTQRLNHLRPYCFTGRDQAVHVLPSQTEGHGFDSIHRRSTRPFGSLLLAWSPSEKCCTCVLINRGSKRWKIK